jgi:hypothetical protein
MPLPAIPAALYALAELAATAGVWYVRYERAQAAIELAQLAAAIEETKKKIGEVIKRMQEEIDVNIRTLAAVDRGGNVTVSRRGNEAGDYKRYIERKIPFRPALSLVCQMALATPIKVPRRLRKKIAGEMVESTIDVTLKQTTASIMLETIDSILKWQSPLKAEPNYDKRSRKAYTGEPDTRPGRLNDVFPFWPRPRGSLAPDLVIVEYRQQSFHVTPKDKDNVFAFVEVKFPNDWVNPRQMQEYNELLGETPASSKRLALLRVPEDCVDFAPKKEGAKAAERENRGRKK